MRERVYQHLLISAQGMLQINISLMRITMLAFKFRGRNVIFYKGNFVPRDKKILIKNTAFSLHGIQISYTHEKERKSASFLFKMSVLVISDLQNLAVMLYFAISSLN